MKTLEEMSMEELVAAVEAKTGTKVVLNRTRRWYASISEIAVADTAIEATRDLARAVGIGK